MDLHETLHQARHHVQHGDIRYGLETYRSVEHELHRLPAAERARILNEMGLCCFYTGQLQEALDYFQKAHADRPSEISICNNIALAAHQLQNFTLSDEFFTRAADLCRGEPTMVPVVIRVFATCLIDRGDYARAIDLLRDSIERVYRPIGDTDDAFLYNQEIPFFDSHAIPLAIAFCQTRRYQEGLDYFLSLRKDLKGSDYMFDALLGIFHANLARYSEAAAHYDRLEGTQAADFNHGMLAARQGRWDVAAERFTRVGPHLCYLGEAFVARARNEDPTRLLRLFARGQKEKHVSNLGLGILDEGYALSLEARKLV